MTGRLAQSRTITAGAAGGGHVAEQVFAHRIGFGFPVAPLHIGDDALERMVALDDVAAVVEVTEFDAFLAGAVKDFLADVLGQFLECHVHIEAEAL